MADADWQFITLSSADRSSPDTDRPYSFSNTLGTTMKFSSNNVQVCLFSMSYDNRTVPAVNPTDPPSEYTYVHKVFFVDSSVVVGLQIRGSVLGNSLRRVDLELGDGNTWTPKFLQWVPAVTGGGDGLSWVAINITDRDGNPAYDLLGDLVEGASVAETIVTLAFRALE